ncbi:MAG: gamma-glutamyl-gamma-aminobutyrate hydrolase family protein [Fimbriimonadaceae bacterium]
MKPLIGITGHVEREPDNLRTGGRIQLNWNYCQAIEDAGGSPLIIPPHADADTIAAVLDGLLIPGGPDIDAREFGEENHPAVIAVHPSRYDVERRLFNAIDAAMPVLGICYGCQFINVQHGGSLIQHLPDVVGHDLDIPGTLQEYTVDTDTYFGSLVGDSAQGQSWHHQAVGRVGQNLTVTARNEDGMIEGLESTNRAWMVGVQWHPERTADQPDSQALFQAFIEASRTYAKSKSKPV